jgi:hypothetical protein
MRTGCGVVDGEAIARVGAARQNTFARRKKV